MGVLKKHGLPVSAKSVTTFILFATSNAFSGYDYWFNNGVPFNRLGGVPHHLIARTAIVLVLLLALKWWNKTKIKDQKSKIKNIFGLLLLGFILASVEPVHWILIVGVLFIVPVLHKFSIFNFQFSLNFQSLKIKNYYPSLFLFLGGLPMAIYIKRLFANPPYLQLATWEASQQVNISIWNFILANGPVMVLAIIGALQRLLQGVALQRALQRQDLVRGLVLIFPLLTIGLFFSPIPRWVGIVNVRFLPAMTTLFLAILATEGIGVIVWILIRVLPQKLGSVRQFSGTSPRLLLLSITLFIMIPSYYVQIQNRIKTEPANAFFYITQNAYESYKEAEKISGQNDTFLVIWPFNWSFPGITGRRVYEGHTLLTSNYYNKELMTRSFFFGDMSTTDMEKMLRVNRIDYVMTYPWMQKINELPNLIKVYDNGMLGVYRVTE